MLKLLGMGLFTLIFAAVPTSTNYTLKSYDIGSGGNSSSSSTNYSLNGIAGSQSGNLQTSSNYGVVSGVNATEGANVPPAPTFTNPANNYDRLKIVINTGNNPSDTKYLIAISSDNFVTTNYIQADNSVSGSQAISNYQTYIALGGASGFTVLGLTPSTTYQIKVKALQGKFSGSAFGPTASAATVATSLTMSLSTTLNPSPPFTVGFSSLTAGTVVNGNADAQIGLTSNANNGGTVYVRSLNGALVSLFAGGNITSATANLSSVNTGYGAQVISTGQTSGGPFASVTPFNGTAANVGGLTTLLQPILATNSPINGGTGTVRLMAKASSVTPSASDYTDTLTFVTAMNF